MLFRRDYNNIIREKFGRYPNVEIINIEKVNRLPKNTFFVDFSFGVEGESDTSFKITFNNAAGEPRETYCQFTSLLGLLTFRLRFFRLIDGKWRISTLEAVVSK